MKSPNIIKIDAEKMLTVHTSPNSTIPILLTPKNNKKYSTRKIPVQINIFRKRSLSILIDFLVTFIHKKIVTEATKNRNATAVNTPKP